MNEILTLLIRHGVVVLFAVVFVDQIGVPLPALPWLLAAGTLVGTGQIHWWTALSAATMGSLLADLIWFQLGRHRGSRVLKLLCRISLEPDSCVRRTQDLFSRYGMWGVVAAKFVPGLGALMPPLAGMSPVAASRFLLFDSLGAVFYSGSLLVAGVLFRNQLAQIIDALASLGPGSFGVLIGALALYLGYKFFQRQRLLNELRTVRITADELHQALEAGGNPLILDLRSTTEYNLDPLLIRGARHMTMDEIELRLPELPRDRDIILYCSCPNEVTSARTALRLHRKGLVRVRPLLGGIDAWRERNYPTERRTDRAPENRRAF